MLALVPPRLEFCHAQHSRHLRTSDERAQRTRFAAISRAVNTRRKDLAHVAEDLAAFNAQKDTAGGYKTMRQYLWHICAAEYNG